MRSALVHIGKRVPVVGGILDAKVLGGQPLQERGHILALHRIHTAEGTIVPTLSNAVGTKPPNFLGVRCVFGNVREAVLIGCTRRVSRGTGKTVEEGGHILALHCVHAAERALAVTVNPALGDAIVGEPLNILGVRRVLIHIIELHTVGHTVNGVLIGLGTIMGNNLEGVFGLGSKLHVVPNEHAILLLSALAHGLAVKEQLGLIAVRVRLDLLGGLVPLGEALAGKVHELVVLVPVRLEEVVGVLLRHMVVAKQTLGVESFLATGVAVRREVEHVPDEACSHVVAVLDVVPVRFKQVGLVFLVVLITIRVFGTVPGEGAVHFRMLVDIGTSAVFRKHHRIGTQNLLILVHLGGQRFNKLLVTLGVRALHCALETDIKVHAGEINLGTPLCRGVDRISAIDVRLHDQAVGIFLVSQINQCGVKRDKLGLRYLEVLSVAREILAIAHFVLHTPHDDGGIVVALTNHLGELVRNRVLVGIGLRVDQVVRDLAIYQQALFIGHLVEGGIMRIMGRTNSVHTHVEHGVDVLGHLITGDGVPHTLTILVVAHAMNFDLLAVQIGLAIGNVERTETDLRAFRIQYMSCSILQGDVHRIQVGIGTTVPTMHVGDLLVQLLFGGFGSGIDLNVGARLAHNISGIIGNGRFQHEVRSFRSLVRNIHSRIHGRIVAIELVVHEDTGAALVLSRNVLVGQGDEFHVTVDSRELRVIDIDRDGNRIDIGHVDGKSDRILVLHVLGQVEDEGGIATDVGTNFLPIDFHRGVLVGTVELDEQVLPVVLGDIKLLAVRDGLLIELGNVRHCRMRIVPRMRQIDGPLGSAGGECPSIHAGVSPGERPALIDVLNRSTGDLVIHRCAQRIIGFIGGVSILSFSLNCLAVGNVRSVRIQLFRLCTGNTRREHGNSQQGRKIFPSHLLFSYASFSFEHIKEPPICS